MSTTLPHMGGKPDLQKLEALAKAATPGPWRWGDWSAPFGTLEDPDHMFCLEQNLRGCDPTPYIRKNEDECERILSIDDPIDNEADRAYLAAMSPDVVLALIAEIRRLEDLLESARERAMGEDL